MTMMNKRNFSVSAMVKCLFTLFLVFAFISCKSQKTTTQQNNTPQQEELVQKDDTPSVDKDQIVIQPDKLPQFPGGLEAMMQHISSNLRYPKDLQRAGATGRIVTRFVVSKDGKITELQTLSNSISFQRDEKVVTLDKGNLRENVITLQYARLELEKEAKRVIKGMPKWEPGIKDGEKVDVYFTIPIKFGLR